MIELYVMLSGTRPILTEARKLVEGLLSDLFDVEAINILHLPSSTMRAHDDLVRDLVLCALDAESVEVVRVISAFDHHDSLASLLAGPQKRLISNSTAELGLFVNADLGVTLAEVASVVSSSIEHRFTGVRVNRDVGGEIYPEWAVVCGAIEDIRDALPENGYPDPFSGGVTYVSSSIENAGCEIQIVTAEIKEEV